MLKCVAAHWLVVDSSCVMPCAGIALDEDGVVRSVFSLNDAAVEKANTTFVDGFVAPFFTDVDGVLPENLKSFLQDAAGRFGSSLNVGTHSDFFNYYVSEGGTIVVSSLSELFKNKK